MAEPFFFDTIPANVFTWAGVTIGGGPNGFGSNNGDFIHSAADQDFFRVFLRADELYQFQVNTPNSNLDPTIQVHNAAGAPIPGAFDDDGGPGTDSLLTFRPTTSGFYYLNVGGFGNSTGQYNVEAREVPGNTSTYSNVVANGSVRGDIQDAADQDWHRVTLTAGQNYTFDVDGHSLSDPTLAVRNAAGGLLAFNDDAAPGVLDPHINFHATVGGTYYLDVGGYSSHTGSYTLFA
jgi:hypothetical protein